MIPRGEPSHPGVECRNPLESHGVRPAMNRPAQNAPEGRPSVISRKAGGNRVLWVALAISAALHLLLVFLYPFLTAPAPGGVVLPGSPRAGEVAQGTQLVAIEEVAEVAVDTPESPTRIEEPEVGAPSVDAPLSGGEPGPGIVAPGPAGRSAAELLRPQEEDSLVWRQVDPALVELTDQERAELRMRWAMTEWNEAMAAEQKAAEEALDWTYTDADGKKWGVSPGKLHLGGLTLPLPLGFGAPPGRSAELDRRTQEWDAIEAQAGRARVWETWEQRAKEIRARKDREREQERAARPDTSRVRR